MSIDPEMLKILQNLENAQQIHEDKKQARAEGKEVVSEDSQEMYNILKRLEDATTKASKRVLNERDSDPVVAVAMKKDSTVTMGQYHVVMEKRNLTQKYVKTYYDITDNTGNIIHKDIALFETAMAVLKNLINERTSKVSKLIELDCRYASYLAEAAYHKERSKTITESVKMDVAVAKQGNAMDKASYIKKQIKALI
jgi:oligoribonuclease (3'-5' exoribonuclease)